MKVEEEQRKRLDRGIQHHPEMLPKLKKVVYENQDRNQPCRRNKDCLDNLKCEGASRGVLGICTFVCTDDASCGNGYLCRSGACQRDCAEVGEKCSARRVCCFFDEDGDKNTDAECRTSEEEDELRCRI